MPPYQRGMLELGAQAVRVRVQLRDSGTRPQLTLLELSRIRKRLALSSAAIKGFWTTRPSFSTVYFLFAIFVVSTVFHCHQHLALVLATWAYSARVVLAPRHLPWEVLFTINSKGHLGNQMGEYATLYTLAKLNGQITLPVLHSTMASRIPWQNCHLNDWMEEAYRHFLGRYVRLMGYPSSWTFYHHLRQEILQEFTLHNHVREEAQRFLRGLQSRWAEQATVVGVHVCRGDYVRVMPRVWKGVLADRGYLQRALDWFQARYRLPVFVVASDDMAWCRETINSSLGDVCSHTVITVGAFGTWAAYLMGGDTIYLANFTRPHSPFNLVFRPQAAFLPEWVGMAADLGQAGQNGL
ncbi:vacuolar sorting protein VPS33/slp1 [Saguinus oedipus]|uniref:L-Fucosyltransferase n=1 Tax=Saguinus oedipus TaxID=9490 RepID=A0ABQ9TWJ2_SAGOE|nr:vacuolar sorting protein VPS33/slp1 [Saguinus oedipus]